MDSQKAVTTWLRRLRELHLECVISTDLGTGFSMWIGKKGTRQMPCRVPKRRFSCGAPQHLTKNQDLTRSINDSEFLFWCCDAKAGPKPSLLRRVGAELHSPSNMFLGLPLRFKSVLWNSGRICLTTVRIGTSLSFLIYLQTREILIIINLLKFPQNSSANEFCKRHLLTRKRFLYFCSRFL